MITGIHQIVVYVSDQRAALDFYVNKLGFELSNCSSGGMLYPGYDLSVGLPGSAVTLVLARRDDRAPSSGNPILLACDDLSKTYDEFVAKGVKFQSALVPAFRCVRFEDPDGNVFDLSDAVESWINQASLNDLKAGKPGDLVGDASSPPHSRLQRQGRVRHEW